MDFQYIIVAIILLLAAAYAAKLAVAKLKAFSPRRNDCGDQCGCSTKGGGQRRK
jgi:hypothetical protein